MKRRALALALAFTAALGAAAAPANAAPPAGRAERAQRARRAPMTQAAGPITLQEVLASAKRAYPLLRAAELEQVIAQGELTSAEGGFDVSWKTRAAALPVGYYRSVRAESVLEQPTPLWGTTAFAGWRLGRGEFAVYDGKLQTLEYGDLFGGLSVPLFRNGPIDRRRANIRRAEFGREIASLSVRQQLVEIVRAATHRYWTWVAAGRKLAIAAELLGIAEARDAGLAVRVEAGDIPRFERVDNARAVQQRRGQVAMARRSLEQAGLELSLLLRDARNRPVVPPLGRLPRDLPEPARSPAPASPGDLSFALVRRPEPRRFALQMQSNRVELAWAKNQLAPALDLQLIASRDLGSPMESRPDLGKPVLELSVLLDIPLQTRVAAGRIDAANAMIARLRLQQAFATERVETDVRDAHSALRAAAERVDVAREEVRLAREIEAGERTRFANGDSQLLLVNIREQQTAEARLRKVDALLDYHRAIADLRAARGEG